MYDARCIMGSTAKMVFFYMIHLRNNVFPTREEIVQFEQCTSARRQPKKTTKEEEEMSSSLFSKKVKKQTVAALELRRLRRAVYTSIVETVHVT